MVSKLHNRAGRQQSVAIRPASYAIRGNETRTTAPEGLISIVADSDVETATFAVGAGFAMSAHSADGPDRSVRAC
jgi:hypothetical protein